MLVKTIWTPIFKPHSILKICTPNKKLAVCYDRWLILIAKDSNDKNVARAYYYLSKKRIKVSKISQDNIIKKYREQNKQNLLQSIWQ